MTLVLERTKGDAALGPDDFRQPLYFAVQEGPRELTRRQQIEWGQGIVVMSSVAYGHPDSGVVYDRHRGGEPLAAGAIRFVGQLDTHPGDTLTIYLAWK